METGINVEKNIGIHLENKEVSRKFFWFIFIAYALICMTKNCYNGAMASIVSEGVLTKSQTGLITAVFYLVYAPMQIVGGIVADKFSPQRMIKIGLIGAAIANVAISLNQNYYVMLTAWAFNGIVQFGIWPSIFKIVSSQLVRSDRVQMIFYLSFTSTGGLVLAYLMAAVLPSWEYNFVVSAIVLFALATILHIYNKHISPYMKWDKKEEPEEKKEEPSVNQPSTMKVFVKSGFFFVCVAVLLSITVSQSKSTLSSIMFVENYQNVSPSLGNILTIVFVLSGIAGTIIAKKFCDSVRNELVAMGLVLALEIPLLAICIFIGKVPVFAVVVILAIVAALESIANLFRNYYNVYFVKYGKSGTAAGILNAAMSVSYMLAAYIMPKTVEIFSWKTYLTSLPILIGISALALLVVCKTFMSFKKGKL